MNKIKRISIITFAAVALLCGLTPARSFKATAEKSGRIEIGWKHKERAVETVDSKFKINLPYISPGAEWLVGVKPINAGEKEKMYIGVFTWEDDKNKSANGKAFKQLSRMEDYPEELSSFVGGYATLNGSINPNETLVIYMELAPSTQTIFNENGQERMLNASEGSYLIFDGQVEKTLIEHTGSLIAKANARKLRKEFAKPDLMIMNPKFGMVSVANELAPQGCITESPIESCVGGQCTCWSVTTTCGGYSCSSAGGACAGSGGVSISWSLPTVCNF